MNSENTFKPGRSDVILQGFCHRWTIQLFACLTRDKPFVDIVWTAAGIGKEGLPGDNVHCVVLLWTVANTREGPRLRFEVRNVQQLLAIAIMEKNFS